MSETESANIRFADLGLPDWLLQALNAVGYETPSPIQAQTIPLLLAGRDVLGQAQTGTGKTAAFALPMLSRIDVNQRAVQVLILAPTRELAIQVAEAFQKYAVNLPGFHVLPIYGGQSYTPQLSALKRGPQVVVGTPGRVMDHLKRGTLNLGSVHMVGLDEADEMLNMGFQEDVEWILEHMPKERQVALFSATMPNQIKRIAQTHLRDPAEVLIRSKTTTATNIRQRYWMVSGLHKMDALTRLLEVETFDAMIIFARTKFSTEELAEKLEARGYAAAPLNGDIPQQLRERTVQRLRDGQLDIIVATDVAARGLNVERISHVLNFDIPLDIESYVHRIGRTGRAGRSGEAILFVAPREKRMLFAIERATRQPIEHMTMPSVDDVNNQRIVRFKQRIADTLAAGELELFKEVVAQFENEQNVPALDIAAALAKLAQGKTPLQLTNQRGERSSGFEPRGAGGNATRPARPPRERPARASYDANTSQLPAAIADAAPQFVQSQPVRSTVNDSADDSANDVRPTIDGGSGHDHPEVSDKRPRRDRESAQPEFARGDARPKTRESRDSVRMETYRVAVGHEHQVKPGNIVGAIANEAGIDSQHIGRIEIFDRYSLVDLPEGMPREILQHLKKVWVAGQELRISLQRPDAGRSGGERDAAATARDSRPPRRFDRESSAQRDAERPRGKLGLDRERAPRGQFAERPRARTARSSDGRREEYRGGKSAGKARPASAPRSAPRSAPGRFSKPSGKPRRDR